MKSTTIFNGVLYPYPSFEDPVPIAREPVGLIGYNVMSGLLVDQPTFMACTMKRQRFLEGHINEFAIALLSSTATGCLNLILDSGILRLACMVGVKLGVSCRGKIGTPFCVVGFPGALLCAVPVAGLAAARLSGGRGTLKEPERVRRDGVFSVAVMNRFTYNYYRATRDDVAIEHEVEEIGKYPMTVQVNGTCDQFLVDYGPLTDTWVVVG